VSVRAVSGNLSALHKLLDGEALKARMLSNAAAQALTLVMLGFRDQKDPTDTPWKPLQSRDGMILVRTARMRNSFTSRATARGFIVGSNVEYTQYHQYGTNGRRQSQTRHMVMPYASDFLMAGKLGTKRGRFISRKQAKTLSASKYGSIGVHVFSVTFAEGSGKIPERPMVPVNGQLTAKWQLAIEWSCGEVVDRAAKEAGAR
jgi:phage gpG-like protein